MKTTFSADGFTSRYDEAPCRERDLNEPHTPRRRTLSAAGTVKAAFPIPLCWNCNRKFRGRHVETVRVHGHDRQVHISCATELRESGLVDSAEALDVLRAGGLL